MSLAAPEAVWTLSRNDRVVVYDRVVSSLACVIDHDESLRFVKGITLADTYSNNSIQ